MRTILLPVLCAIASAAWAGERALQRQEVCAAILQARAHHAVPSPAGEAASTREAVNLLGEFLSSAAGLGLAEMPTKTSPAEVSGSLADAQRSERLRNSLACRLYEIDREHREGGRRQKEKEAPARDIQLLAEILTGEQKDAFHHNMQHALSLSRRGFQALEVLAPAIAGGIMYPPCGIGLTFGAPLMPLMATWVAYSVSRNGVPWNVGRYLRKRWPEWGRHEESLTQDPAGYVLGFNGRLSARLERSLHGRMPDEAVIEASRELAQWTYRRQIVDRDNIWSELHPRVMRDPELQPVWIQIDLVQWNEAPGGKKPLLIFVRTSRQRPVAWAAERERSPSWLARPALAPR